MQNEQVTEAVRMALEAGRTKTRNLIRNTARRLRKPPLSEQEVRFRKYFNVPSRAATRALVKLTILDYVRRAVKVTENYVDRRDNFNSSVLGGARLGFSMSGAYDCMKHMDQLAVSAMEAWQLMLEVHRMGRDSQPDFVPEQIFDKAFLGPSLYARILWAGNILAPAVVA